MKRSYYLLTVHFLLFAILLWGCGSKGPGAPGSGGTEDTGVDARVTGVTHSDPNGDAGDAWQIDLVQDECAPDEYETWGDDFANITFSGMPIYSSASDNILYITNYRVTFYQLDPTFPPIDEIQAGVQGSYIIIPNYTTGPYQFLVLDTGRKNDIYNSISNNTYIPTKYPLEYNMEIEIWGKDQYDNDFTIGPIIRHILINDYDHC